MLTSYLTLRDRLSQVWLNTYTLALLLAVFKLAFFSTSIRNAIGQSETYVISHCASIDAIYNNGLNNTPHYLGVMSNYLLKEAMEQSVKASLKTLSLLVYVSEELVSFSIDLYLGTYACLIVSAIDGSVDVATNTTEKILDLVNSTVIGFADDLDDGLGDISNIINKIISAASKIESLFTGNNKDDGASDKIKQVNLTISSLRDFQIPSSIDDKLRNLSDKTPDFATLKNMTKTLISVPFTEVRNEIDAMNATGIVGDPKLLYVPPLVNSSDTPGICGKNIPTIKKLYDSLDHTLMIATVVCLVLMVLAAIVMMIPPAWSEYRYWRRLKELRDQYQRTILLEKDPFTESNVQPSWDIIAALHNCFHHWNAKVSRWLFTVISKLNRKKPPTDLDKIKVQWVVSYTTSSRALCVLGIGLIALTVCILQLILIAVLRNAIESKGDSTVRQLLNNSAISFEEDINNWSKQTNIYINSTEANMNEEVFGWLDTTTVSINDTVNKMMTGIDDTLADAFNNTILYSPMNTVVGCVIGNKLAMVEKAMTWIHDTIKFSLPRINATDINSVMNNQLQNDSSTDTKSSFSGFDTVDEMRSALVKVLDSFHKTAMWELTIALLILSVWVFQLPIAIAILLYRSRKPY